VRDGRTRREHRLGPDWLNDEHPQGVVPAGVWQSARSLGPWTLVGCTVAPGFEFAFFEMGPDGFEP
jgi:predicted cupin superfamily sugar epimerase